MCWNDRYLWFVLTGCGNTGGKGGGSGSGNYSVSGTISGLTASGLVLSETVSTQTIPIQQGATGFTVFNSVPTGTSYNVVVKTQPSGETCTVTNGSGTVGTANVTNIQVACTASSTGNTYTIGGSITGLTASGLTLKETVSGQTVSPAANATTFQFATAVSSGANYLVSVSAQPTGETCTVTNGSGTVSTANVTNIQVACTASSTSGANDALLNGAYAFLVQGWTDGADNGSTYQMAAVGSFVADGNGNILSGSADINTVGDSGQASITGTYTLPSTNQGQMTLQLQSGSQKSETITLAFSAGTIQSNIATAGSIIEFDDSTGIGTPGGERFTGKFALQNKSDFTVASLTGGYAFGAQGETCPIYFYSGGPTPNSNCSATPTEGPLAVAGTMNLSGTGSISSGMEDIGLNDGNCPTSNGSPTCTSDYPQATFSGAYGTPDATTGRTTLTLTVPGTLPSGTQAIWPTNYVAYIVNAQKLYILSTDSHLSTTLLAGEAIQNTVPFNSFTNANLNGNVIIYDVDTNDTPGWGSSSYTPQSSTTIGLLQANGSSGTIAATLQQNKAGNTSTKSISGADFSVASNGRITLSNVGNQPPVFYLSGSGIGFGIEEGGAPGLFHMEPQTATTPGNATYVGTYFVPVADTSVDTSMVTLNSGSASILTSKSTSSGSLSTGLSSTNTYTVDPTGLFTVSGANSPLGYVISPSRFVVADGSGNTTPGITVLQK